MATSKREKTKYTGVTYRIDSEGDKVFYIRYRCGGREAKLIEEPIGKASAGMTAAKAASIRSDRMRGKELSNTARRERVAKVQAENMKNSPLAAIWQAYQDANPQHKGRSDKEMALHLLNEHGLSHSQIGALLETENLHKEQDSYRKDINRLINKE